MRFLNTKPFTNGNPESQKAVRTVPSLFYPRLRVAKRLDTLALRRRRGASLPDIGSRSDGRTDRRRPLRRARVCVYLSYGRTTTTTIITTGTRRNGRTVVRRLLRRAFLIHPCPAREPRGSRRRDVSVVLKFNTTARPIWR